MSRKLRVPAHTGELRPLWDEWELKWLLRRWTEEDDKENDAYWKRRYIQRARIRGDSDGVE